MGYINTGGDIIYTVGWWGYINTGFIKPKL